MCKHCARHRAHGLRNQFLAKRCRKKLNLFVICLSLIPVMNVKNVSEELRIDMSVKLQKQVRLVTTSFDKTCHM